MAVTITNNGIILPRAGETASIAFAFKNQMTNDPIIFSGRDSEHRIVVNLIDPTTGKNVFPDGKPKEYVINKNTEPDDAYGWHVFDTNEIITEDEEDMGQPATEIEKPEKFEANVLYKNIVGETKSYKYYVKNTDNNTPEDPTDDLYDLRLYDYTNSSIQVDFLREDTKDLEPKDYEFSITYYTYTVDGDNKELVEQYTLLEPIKFTIKERNINAVH